MIIEGTTEIVHVVRTADVMGMLSPPAVRRSMSHWGSTESKEIFTELTRLLTLERYNDSDRQATPRAHKTALGFLETAGLFIKVSMPEFTPDGEGGIDIEWENNGRHLALGISGHTDADFLSWREPQGGYEGKPATQKLLNEKLEWLRK